MKCCLLWTVALALIVCGCSSEPDTQAHPPKPAEVHVAATDSDALLMAEYLVFTQLTDSLIYRPLKDTAAMFRAVGQLDMTKPNYSTNMMHATLEYLHGVFSNAMLPMQQFGGSVKTPPVKHMADELNSRLQQVTNQYVRALKILEQGGDDAARREQLNQVALLLQSSSMTASRFRFDEESSAVFEAARRTLGR